VAVTNSFAAHYETLESIASLFPLDALNMTTGCDKHNIQFDFHVETRQKDKRVKLWVDYFETTLKGTNVNASSPRATDADDKVSRRTFGELQVHEHTGTYILAVPRQRSSNNMTSMVLFYDATIEASCYCSPRQLKWMKADAGRSCIFHEQCPHMIADPRAVWLSPHHNKYYIPSVLPGGTSSAAHHQQQQKQQHKKQGRERQPPVAVNQTGTVPHKLCVVGGTLRRNWGQLRGYLESPLGMAAITTSRFTIHILGYGDYPKELENYRNVTTKPRVKDDSEFYEAVRQCHGLILLLSKASQGNYFPTTAVADSKEKLTGSIPIVIAYQLPVVIHEELYDLYQEPLQTIWHATHSDNDSSFNAAMNQLLDVLDE
jgi:hypothetical protein